MAGSSGDPKVGKSFLDKKLRVGVVGHPSRVAAVAAEIEAASLTLEAVGGSARGLSSRLQDEPGVVIVHCCPLSAAKARTQLLMTKRTFSSASIVALIPAHADDHVGRVAREVSLDGVVHGREPEALVPTVLAVGAGQVVVPRFEHRRDVPATFSHRERQVLRLAVAGCTNDSIAQELYLSCSTVKSHLTSAFAKLSVRSRQEAAVLLLDPEQPASRLVFSDLDSPPVEQQPVGGAAL
jgi:DNA-binding NarL/FixJ family response regulator